ncbi:MAG: HisA/HisF-related TIM barrel protein, partial [Anaerolineales bacterium]
MSNFIVYPALDLRGGQIVRLKQGDPERQTTYNRYPGEVARRWLKTGARWLHVINLDGAFGGEKSSNREGLRQILEQARQVDAAIQFGGGIRTFEDIEGLLSLGVERVILGTTAAQNPDLIQEAVTRFSAQRVSVGVDVRDGVVQVRGWTEETDLAPITFGKLLKKMGLVWAIYTDIHRDGLARGLNIS